MRNKGDTCLSMEFHSSPSIRVKPNVIFPWNIQEELVAAIEREWREYEFESHSHLSGSVNPCRRSISPIFQSRTSAAKVSNDPRGTFVKFFERTSMTHGIRS